MLVRRQGKRDPHQCWWKSKLVQPLWKTVWRLFKKQKIELPYDSAIPFLVICLRECELDFNKGTCIPLFIAALFIIAKLWKQPRCPTTDEWINKCGIYIQWNFTQPQRRMKFCYLQVNGWN
jgi:hypothetical protein